MAVSATMETEKKKSAAFNPLIGIAVIGVFVGGAYTGTRAEEYRNNKKLDSERALSKIKRAQASFTTSDLRYYACGGLSKGDSLRQHGFGAFGIDIASVTDVVTIQENEKGPRARTIRFRFATGEIVRMPTAAETYSIAFTCPLRESSVMLNRKPGKLEN